MDDFDGFLGTVFRQGRVVFRRRPEPAPAVSARALGLLEEAYARYRLDVAGPAVPFDPQVAAEAGELVRQACWAVVSREDRVEDLGRRLTTRRAPSRPSDHLSADLLLRYLPRVYRRARAVDPCDPVVSLLADVLRRWPLSGVLAGLDEPPLGPTDMGGHPGLLLLYAERFAASPGRPAWCPTGPGAEYLEWALSGTGRGEATG
jgi:hypothetical protein